MANTKNLGDYINELVDRVGLLQRGIENGSFDPIDYSTHDAEQAIECATDEINKVITEWTFRDFDGRAPRDPHREHRHLQHEIV